MFRINSGPARFRVLGLQLRLQFKFWCCLPEDRVGGSMMHVGIYNGFSSCLWMLGMNLWLGMLDVELYSWLEKDPA